MIERRKIIGREGGVNNIDVNGLKVSLKWQEL